jgi:hypothetical protein
VLGDMFLDLIQAPSKSLKDTDSCINLKKRYPQLKGFEGETGDGNSGVASKSSNGLFDGISLESFTYKGDTMPDAIANKAVDDQNALVEGFFFQKPKCSFDKNIIGEGISPAMPNSYRIRQEKPSTSSNRFCETFGIPRPIPDISPVPKPTDNGMNQNPDSLI